MEGMVLFPEHGGEATWACSDLHVSTPEEGSIAPAFEGSPRATQAGFYVSMAWLTNGLFSFLGV